MSDWHYAQKERAEEFGEVRMFTVKKHQGSAEIPFRITLTEFATPPAGQSARFFAQADKAVNQKTAPVIPAGWGNNELSALSDCLRMLRQFPYEGD